MAFTSNVFATPGTPSSSAWLRQSNVTSTCTRNSSCPTTTLPICSRSCSSSCGTACIKNSPWKSKTASAGWHKHTGTPQLLMLRSEKDQDDSGPQLRPEASAENHSRQVPSARELRGPVLPEMHSTQRLTAE